MRYFQLIAEIISTFEKHQRVKLLLFQILVILAALVEILGIASVMPFIGLLTNPELIRENQYLRMLYEYFEFSNEKYFLVFLGCGFLIFMVIANILNALNIGVGAFFSARLHAHFSTKLLKFYLSKDYSFFSEHHSAQIINQVDSQVGRYASSVINPFLVINSKFVVLIFAFTALIFVDSIITLSIIFILGGSYIIIYKIFKNKLEVISTSITQDDKQTKKYLIEGIHGIREIKIYHLEKQHLNLFSQTNLNKLLSQARSILFSALPRYLIESIGFGGLILICFYFILKSDTKAFLPLLSLYAITGYRMLPLAQNIYGSFATIKSHINAFHQIKDDLIAAKAVFREELSPSENEDFQFKDRILFNKISFEYPGSEEKQIKDLTLEIPKNYSIAFVGKTGCGKTTLINMLLGLLTPMKGNLWIDEKKINATNLMAWQKKLAFVSQDVFLMEGSIAQNIAFGLEKQEINLEKVKQVARIADIEEYIESLPNSYQSVIGERGINLSGGQKQRIAIARALYRDPEVLVLDEATSALDNETERNVMNSIDEMKGSCTLILIAHRITTVKNCDQICFMEKGKIVEKGTFEELVANSKKFQKFL